jgi:hypothetical protein
VRNEVEALMLEYSLIKQHRPRFNVRLRDDKSYPFLAVTVDDQWPRALVMRGRKRKGTRYFGPYAHAYAIRDTLDLLLRSFPIRTCSRPSSTSTSASDVPACCSTSRSAQDRAWARSTRCRTGNSSTSCRVPRRRHRGDRRRLEADMQRPPPTSSSSGRPVCETGCWRCARRSRSSRWWPTATRTST